MLSYMKTFFGDVFLLLESLVDPDPRMEDEERIEMQAEAIWTIILLFMIGFAASDLIYVMLNG